MSHLIIKYTLKPGVTQQDFERWVHDVDYPSMRGLDRVRSFVTYRVTGKLMGEGVPSVQYVEIFDVTDLSGFTAIDMPGSTVQMVMGQFMGFADAPEFLIVEEVR